MVKETPKEFADRVNAAEKARIKKLEADQIKNVKDIAAAKNHLPQ